MRTWNGFTRWAAGVTAAASVIGSVTFGSAAMPSTAMASADAELTPFHLTDLWYTPSNGDASATEMVVPITVNDAPDESGYYFAATFFFTGVDYTNPDATRGDGAGYMGIQPNPGGRQNPHFSVFAEKSFSEPLDPHCAAGADNGAGVTCQVPNVELVHGHRYDFTITKDTKNEIAPAKPDTTVWYGTVTDKTTRKSTRLGAWRIPARWGDLSGEIAAFFERYLPIRKLRADSHG